MNLHEDCRVFGMMFLRSVGGCPRMSDVGSRVKPTGSEFSKNVHTASGLSGLSLYRLTERTWCEI